MLATAKLFTNGKSQAVRLPKEYRFDGKNVGITRIGKMVVLYPQESAWEMFNESEPVTDDFCEAILQARRGDTPRVRQSAGFCPRPPLHVSARR
jgi:antitoxin VapB